MLRIKVNILMLLIVSALFVSEAFAGKDDPKAFTVVIDPGHGGKDIGAADNGAREKDINLGVALELQKMLKKKLKEINVVMTRDNDTYLTLQQRADVANKAKGDLFISIHTNSVDKKNKNRKTVAGSSVYALGLHKDENNMKVARRENSVIELESNYEQKYSGFDPNRDESYIIFEMAQKKNLSKSIRFAEGVQKELVGIGRKNRGVHQAGFWVLWATSMPSVLIELDFICNPVAAKYMTSSKGEKEFAEAIYKAIKKYYDSWDTASKPVPLNDVVYEKNDNDSEVGQDNVSASGQDSYVARLPKVEKKKRNDTPSVSRQSYTTAKRRRRSERAKTASDNRNVETSSIPLHTEREREASLVSMSDEDVMAESLVKKNPVSQEKKGGKKTKKEKKEKKKKEKKQRNANAHNAKVEKFVTVYKIQILASADLLRQNNPRFCGLKPISTYKENNLYKYYYGESTDKGKIETMLKEVQEKIPDAFIVSAKKSNGSAKK